MKTPTFPTYGLLSQGDDVIVVEPAELRAAIAETLESAAAAYREEQ